MNKETKKFIEDDTESGEQDDYIGPGIFITLYLFACLTVITVYGLTALLIYVN